MNRFVLGVRKAISLFNARQVAANFIKGNDSRTGIMTPTTLGKLILPDASYTTQTVTMSNLMNCKKKKLDPVWIRKIAEATGVDENFILGSPSNFDNEYNNFFDKK